MIEAKTGKAIMVEVEEQDKYDDFEPYILVKDLPRIGKKL